MLAYKFTRPTENTEDANQQIENATQIATCNYNYLNFIIMKFQMCCKRNHICLIAGFEFPLRLSP